MGRREAVRKQRPAAGFGPAAVCPPRCSGAAKRGVMTKVVEVDQWRGSMWPNNLQMSKTCVKH
eukprot:4751557-Pyramimonas_sp.AAC.1